MIGHLRGAVLSLSPQLVVLDVGGVGYQVHVPLQTSYALERRGSGHEVSLFVHTHVRDDAIMLFGFLEARERTLFERLIAISGIGPKLAQGILSGMPPNDLAAAIRGGDLRRLNAIPGVGKKTAERLVLELKDKVSDLVGASADPTSTIPAAPAARDAIDALISLGYRSVHAERAVAAAERAATKSDGEGPATEDLVRAALRRLGGGA